MAMQIDVRLLDHPVSPVDLAPFPEAAGAECVFLGRTRAESHAEHGPLVRLNYQVYGELARSTLLALAEQAVRRFGCLAVRLHHSVGDVAIGRASVLVQVAAPHRGKAFEACRFLIDELKATAPIWKREVWADGTTWSEGTPARPPERGAP